MSKDAKSKSEIETGSEFIPRYDGNGLVTAIVCDAQTKTLLMVAHINKEALALTIETGEAHFYSRSRSMIWHKGATSGNVLIVKEMRVDCDQDAVLLLVKTTGAGAACHTGRKSCFYRQVQTIGGVSHLEMVDDEPLFDPKKVYNC
ncbi:MAG: phosphoribosyl-AMP cyclohydrolase [Rhizobiaceae bacterium]